MKTTQVSFYFVLYLIAVCSSFEAMRRTSKYGALADSIAVAYFNQKIILSIPHREYGFRQFEARCTTDVQFWVVGLLTESERKNVQYRVECVDDQGDPDFDETITYSSERDTLHIVIEGHDRTRAQFRVILRLPPLPLLERVYTFRVGCDAVKEFTKDSRGKVQVSRAPVSASTDFQITALRCR